VYETIRRDGTQKAVISQMQTREELYERINYYEFEKALDQFQVTEESDKN
jgi:methylisocitrate lyase